MKGDGEDKRLRDFLSLGSSGSWEREDEEPNLSRDGLNMLAGGFHGGFTLKPPPAPGMRSFGGFHRPKTTWPASPAPAPGMGMGIVFVNEESATHGSSSVVAKLEQPLGSDVESLTPGECWSVVLKLGKRWPVWNRSTMTLPSPQGVRSALQLEHERRVGGNSEVMLGQGSLDLLTTRALEALAQAPAGSMQAPRQTTQQFSEAKAVRDPPSQAAAAIPRQSAKPPTHSSRVMAAAPATGPRTAPLTIFYDGKVNVCDNVPEDKAHLIMLFAQRASIAPPPAAAAEAPASSPPSTSAAASSQVTPQPQATSSPRPAAVVLPSHHLAPRKHHSELGSSSHRQPPESSNAPSRATTTTTEANTSRQLVQQCLNGPMSKRLPNARKNSLARFLDSRKRNRPNASASEDPPSKRQEPEPEPSDASAGDSSSKPCLESKEGMMYINDA